MLGFSATISTLFKKIGIVTSFSFDLLMFAGLEFIDILDKISSMQQEKSGVLMN